MQAMIRKLLVIATIFTLSGCASTGSPWDRTTYSRPAQNAPSRLTKEPAAPPLTEQQQVYTAYDPTLQTVNKPLNHEGVQVQPQTQTAPNDFDVMIGNNNYIPSETNGYTATQPEVFTPAPVLPSVRVALLLPLSGQHADLGQAMLQASQLALFDMGYDSFELMPRDTRGTPQGASQAAQSAVTDGAQLILGPLFANSVRAAKPIANRYNINMISFSTDWSQAGGNAYTMGFLPFAQIRRVAEYASMNGLLDIGILAPNTDYGNAVIAAYNSLAYRTGMNTAEVVRYATGESDISGIIRSFTKYDERTLTVEEMKLPLEERLRQNPNDYAAKIELGQIEKMDTWGELPFQAVLLPVGGDQARSIGNLMSFYDLGPGEVKRLGTGLWDDNGLATEPALDGSWFAAPSPDLRRDFEGRYKELYGEKPPRLASLSYDATALAAVLAKKSYYTSGRPSFERDALINPNGFAGIDGIFRFRPDGLIERGLAILEFQNGTIQVVDPAPATFQRTSY